MTLIFGELVPKKIAINNPYKIACLFIGLISFVKTFFSPLIKLLTLSTNFICKIFKIKENEDKITEDEIKKIILLGNTEGVIEEKEKDYILNIFNFNDIEVEKIMTKKEDLRDAYNYRNRLYYARGKSDNKDELAEKIMQVTAYISKLKYELKMCNEIETEISSMIEQIKEKCNKEIEIDKKAKNNISKRLLNKQKSDMI